MQIERSLSCLFAIHVHIQVVEGAVDDIRQVSYAIAVTRHPFCDEDNEGDETMLEFPWLVSELAIVGNQPVW